MDFVDAFAEHGGGCLRATLWTLGIMGLILVLDKAFYDSEPDLPPSAPAYVQPHPTEAKKEVAWNDCVFEAADRAYLNKGIDIGKAGVGPLPDYKPLRNRVRDLGLALYEVRGWLTLVYGNFHTPDKRIDFTCRIQVLEDPTYGWETHVLGFGWG